MADLKWHSFFEIGVDFIDEEHKALLSIMMDTRDAIESNNYKEAGKFLEALLTVASEHFLHEEEFLKEVKFPGLDEHIKYHQELLAKTVNTKKVCESIKAEHDTKKCFDDMSEFLIDDILHGDLAFKSYLEYEGYMKK